MLKAGACFRLVLPFLQDNYQKLQDSEPKPKRPRKKTKPSALTRPPKKGKKKRNQRKPARQQKPLPQEDYAEDTGINSVISTLIYTWNIFFC